MSEKKILVGDFNNDIPVHKAFDPQDTLATPTGGQLSESDIEIVDVVLRSELTQLLATINTRLTDIENRLTDIEASLPS